MSTHAHGHDHHHDQAPAPRGPSGAFTAGEARQARRLTTVMGLVATFFGLELAGALVADSVVLQADALHLLMDVLALAVSLFAMKLAVQRPTPRFTYGLRRAEPVAAIFSSVLVLGTTVLIVVEGIESLRRSEPPKAGIMLIVSVCALFVNGLSAWLLHDVIEHPHAHGHAHDADNPDDRDPDHDHHHDHAPTSATAPRRARGHALSLRGAWLHLLGDTLGALAALVAALFVRFDHSSVADPIGSFVVAAILLAGSLRLLRDATMVLLESAPTHLAVGDIHRIVRDFPGVAAVHDLHVWTLGAGHDAITVHVLAGTPDATLGQRLSERIRAALDVEYVTVQVEIAGAACRAEDTSAAAGQAAV
ncbi:MAG: cation diffusion facilitator family transporter [Polyangiaceae bacterium]